MSGQDKQVRERILKKANDRIITIHNVSGWLLAHWDEFPDDLVSLSDNMPYDVRQHISEILNNDLAGAVTITLNWKAILEEDE